MLIRLALLKIDTDRTICLDFFFYGPLVESSFNMMSAILNARSTNMNMETYEAYEVVKNNLKAVKKSVISLYSRLTKESLSTYNWSGTLNFQARGTGHT